MGSFRGFNAMKGVLLLCGLLFGASSYGQKPGPDGRPLRGDPAEHVPLYRPGALQIPSATFVSPSLFELGLPVGRAELDPLPARFWGSLGASVASPGRAGRTIQLAAPASPGITLYRAENGVPYWISLSTPLFVGSVQSVTQAADRAQQALMELRALLGVENPDQEFELESVQEDPSGRWHVRFRQVYQRVPVWGRDLYVHIGPDGVYAINGRYEPTPRGVSTSPTLRPEDALELAIRDLRQRGQWAPPDAATMRWLGLEPPQVQLVLYPDPLRVRLAYSVRLHAHLIGYYEYIISAHTGGILNRIERHCSFTGAPTPTVRARWAATDRGDGDRHPATQFADARAIDLNGRERALRTYRHSNGVYYMIWDLPNLNPQASQLPDNPRGGALTIDARNQDLKEGVQLYHVTSPNNTWTDASAVSAHSNMKVCYDYYRNTFNRRAIDDKDQTMISIIHITQNGQPMDNAFWNGRIMGYGDGAQVFKPLAGGLDVAGHEMTHGVIQHTADLVYQFQPGALNESFADVFGVMIDRDDFLLGEDIMRPGRGPALRDFANPSNPALLKPQPSHMSQYVQLPIEQDNGGVHINSGIPNRAAYLVIQAIGREKAERIYYQALSRYLTRNSQFVDCRLALERAAQDLYGSGAELNAVRQAFDAVGIAASAGGGGGSPTVPPISGGRQLILFMVEDGRIGYWDLAQNRGAVFNHPQARARVSQGGADRAQLSAAVHPQTGRLYVFYITPERQLAAIEVATGQVQVFPLQLRQPGDLWNASVAPDGSLVALISAYEKDPNLYLTDGRQIVRVPLRPESTVEGLQDASIQYADVVAWSPDKRKIGFDAYHEYKLGLSRVAYWGMYELDLSSGKIYNLVPGQSADVNIGNITYGNTNPNLIAFNYVDEFGDWDIVIADLAQRRGGLLNIPNRNIGGFFLEDAMRPTFAPDDRALAFVSPSNRLLLFYELPTDRFGGLQLDVPVYNPKWAVDGGRVRTAQEPVEAPHLEALEVYPNPASAVVRIRFSGTGLEPIQLAVYDLLGRRVRLLYEGLSAGVSEYCWDGRDEAGRPVASGLYLIRLQRSAAPEEIQQRWVLFKR